MLLNSFTRSLLQLRTCFTSPHELRLYSSDAKRPPNSYLLFLAEFKSQCAETGMKGISAKAGRAWRSMTPEEKAPYETEYQRTLQNYLREKTSREHAHLSPMELSQLTEKHTKLRTQKVKLHSLQNELKNIEEASGRPKNPMSIVSVFYQVQGVL
nr:high mobility group B protein 6-like [Lepeophtheirus salmonis]